MSTPYFPLSPEDAAEIVAFLLAHAEEGNDATDAIREKIMSWIGGPEEHEALLAGQDPLPRCRCCAEYGHANARAPECGQHGADGAATPSKEDAR